MSPGILSALLALPPAADPPGLFAPPFAVTADGAVIDVPKGENAGPAFANSYPWFGDFDGDGRPDLLVGQSRGDRR